MIENKSKKSSLEFEVPEGWNVFELEKVVDFLDGKRKPIKDSDRAKIKGIYPYYGASGIIDYVNDYIFDEELILLGEDGANIINRSTPLAFKVSGKIWVNNHAHVLKPKKGSDIDFLTEFLESIKYDKYNTGTAQPKLNKEVCSKIPVLLPPLPEQRAIAQVLGTIDQAIHTTEKLIAKKELRKKWLMQQLLTGKKRLKGFCGEWKENRLGSVCDLVNGMAFKPDEWSNVGMPIIRIQNLNGSKEFNYYDKEVDKRYLVNNGDLLFAWSGSRGTSFGAFRWFGELAILNQHIFNVYPKNGLDRDFAFQILSWLTIEIERKAHGSAGLVHVTKKQFERELMRIPKTKEEQIAIAQVLQAADKEISLIKAKAEKLREQKKGLMQVLLTGKVRLKNIEN